METSLAATDSLVHKSAACNCEH